MKPDYGYTEYVFIGKWYKPWTWNRYAMIEWRNGKIYNIKLPIERGDRDV